MEIKQLYALFLRSTGVTTDSRTLKGGELFFALKGENFDGNAYAVAALEKGAAYAVVDAASEVVAQGDARPIPVPDTLEALQALARYHREHTLVAGKRLPVVGLTGTNGKTTTKELIRAVLSAKYVVTATEGNLNNDIGVPLSLLKIDARTQLAVIEMGASHPDDIAHLVAVSEPDLGLITNVGKAHLLGFGSFEGVKKAKGQLYDYLQAHGGKAFVRSADADLVQMAAARKGLETIPYGDGAIVLPADAAHPFLRMAVPSESDPDILLGVETHLVGTYNAPNVLAALAIGRYFGVPQDDAIAAVCRYEPSNNRSQMMRTADNTLVVDAYNANPTSMAAALDNIANIVSDRKVLMLGSMGELGTDSVAEHVKILERLPVAGATQVLLVGEEFRKALAVHSVDCLWFETSQALADWLKAHPVKDAVVLVKGSRSQQMEKVIPEL